MAISKQQTIVHLTSVHRSYDTRIFQKECKSLAEAGYKVVLIVSGRDPSSLVSGIQTITVPKQKGRSRRFTVTMKDIFVHALRAKGEAYHFHDPELIPLGVLLRILGKRVVYDVHETVPKQILSKEWIPKPLRFVLARIVGLAETIGATMFDGIVAATPGIATAFPQHKTIIVQNFAKLAEFGNMNSLPYTQRGRLVAYIGGISRVRGVIEMIEAIGHLEDARLALGGEFDTEQLSLEVRKLHGWHAVDELGWLSRNEVIEVLGISRAGLLTLHPEPNYLDSYPVKLFEYMLAGIPVIASNFPFWKQFVSDIGSGLMVDPLNPQEIADAIDWLLEHPNEAEEMGRRGREAVLDRYTWESQGERLIEFYDSIIFG